MGRVRRDSDSMGGGGGLGPKRMLPPPPPRIMRGRGRVLASSSISMRGGRGFGLRPTGSMRGRIGRVERITDRMPISALRKRILTTTAVRSRELTRLKTSKMRR